MITKLICRLWGHKFVYDAYTGKTATVTNHLLNREVTIPVVVSVKKEFCLRCGKKDLRP
jgi:hypothetical protein